MKRVQRGMRSALPAHEDDLRVITRTDLFSAFALAGYLAAQGGAPNRRTACRWARTMGALMAQAARTTARHRKRRR